MTATAKNLSAFDFMRYQRSSPDYLALCNGRKPSVRSKEDNHQFDNQNQTYSSILEETKLSRIKSISPSPYPHFSLSSNPFPVQKPQPAGTSPAPIAPSPEGLFRHENNGGFSACGEALLQWGQSKRPRCSRSDSRHAGETDPSRYRSNGFKLPPRCSVSSTSTTGHCTNREPSLSAALSKYKGERRSLPSPPEKTCHNKMAPAASPSRIGCTHSVGDSELATQSGADPEKVKAEQTELPRICLSLSRKEKEEDFFAMKGTKLPQRPKKRAKNIDRSLQYCFPGLWLSDLTRARYEVLEKKCVKKKRSGLKRIDSMDIGPSQ
ncbi:hypothetical protein AXF42_Ash004966 [Apostasia shenzhenica]|uniref:DUF1639 domain-containing protein n=1 Tax=Apostasia shenzhenica TaxID=1088818 RepID=A0A2I0B826_9ASPA|nr:hypothetical protein AXF42_Ash004966 [Apostasia shenzhenica]